MPTHEPPLPLKQIQYHTLSIVEYLPPSKDEIAKKERRNQEKEERQIKRKRGRPRKDVYLNPNEASQLNSNRMIVTKTENLNNLLSSRRIFVHENGHLRKPCSCERDCKWNCNICKMPWYINELFQLKSAKSVAYTMERLGNRSSFYDFDTIGIHRSATRSNFTGRAMSF